MGSLLINLYVIALRWSIAKVVKLYILLLTLHLILEYKHLLTRKEGRGHVLTLLYLSAARLASGMLAPWANLPGNSGLCTGKSLSHNGWGSGEDMGQRCNNQVSEYQLGSAEGWLFASYSNTIRGAVRSFQTLDFIDLWRMASLDGKVCCLTYCTLWSPIQSADFDL